MSSTLDTIWRPFMGLALASSFTHAVVALRTRARSTSRHAAAQSHRVTRPSVARWPHSAVASMCFRCDDGTITAWVAGNAPSLSTENRDAGFGHSVTAVVVITIAGTARGGRL